MALLFLLISAFFYFSSIFNIEKETLESPAELIKTLTLEGVEIEDFKREHKRWKILSTHATFMEETRSFLLEQVEILIYTSEISGEPKVDIHVKAQQGMVDEPSQQVVLSGNVVGTRGSDLQINTEKVIFDYQNEHLSAPDSVILHKENSTFLGVNLNYQLKDKKISMDNVELIR
ncbi:LPS export ABC transporter periplasmic protein LptC [Deltaproteobacteria bacterium TL4]